MIVLLVLLIWPTVVYGTPQIEATLERHGLGGAEELGRAVNLRKIDLLGNFQQSEASIFVDVPSKCFKTQTLSYSGSYYDYYASTKDFYSKLAVSAGLDVSLESTFTLGASLTSVISSKKSTTSRVSGISLNVKALTEKILMDKDCLNDDSITILNKHVLRELETLDVHIQQPWLSTSWRAYNNFLNTFGSHVITSVVRGSRIRQTTFAQSSEAYSQRDFQVRSCVSLSGPTEVGKIGVKACANVSKSEISRTTHMNTIDKLIISGGTKETRNALSQRRTEELIENLLNEAEKSPASVEHTFRAIWHILQARFSFGTDNYIRAVNLQYYYLGFLNYGCALSVSGGVQLQRFDYAAGSKSESPDFECTLASDGCHSPDDCHYRPVWCACRGESCVGHTSTKDDIGDTKERAFANTEHDWGWHGCDWELIWSRCNCYNKNRNKRRTVWRIPSRDAPQKNASHHDHQDDGNSGQDEDSLAETSSGRETEE